MSVLLTPYLNFRDNAREALTFYHSVLGGELTLNTFGEAGMSPDPSEADLIMHGQLVTEAGQTLMGADTPAQMGYAPPAGFAISLSGGSTDEQALRRYFTGLGEGGQVTMPLAKAPWGDLFGMLTDRYGISWMVNVAADGSGA